jgi:hypothetical protein
MIMHVKITVPQICLFARAASARGLIDLHYLQSEMQWGIEQEK